MTEERAPLLLPRLRVVRGETILLGPGKADLLDAIEHHGSLREAAQELGMSYMRAWKLVQTMNAGFGDPLVELHRGGPNRGGARLTDVGRSALRLYRSMETESLRATRRSWKRMQRLMR